MPYKSIFSREEVRSLLSQSVRECRIELLKQGKFGKRGLSVPASDLRACVKRKIESAKRAKIQEVIARL